ncbi:universal stress protein [Amycolatopsis cihanbeyliensis]|uniref:Nucleotide-binding universal stress UspA family protein n=1 Tax=Amycolatopsis cihanbeyliensis TaxID=1128664 RepID=A0A542DR78_AMYCI|nr:universal stress protein [Amycolatopsis cihanbeyliensis]TQJ05608.1 nucleotide-binding universal stress UspA family protein [Amycolatopsis cihanbeyliensis]
MSATERTVLAGFDGSAGARRAVSWAAREAGDRGGRLMIAQAFNWQPPATTFRWVPAEPLAEEPIRRATAGALDALAGDIRQQVPDVEVGTTFRDGPAAPTLAELGEELDAELLVLGACGLSAIPRTLLGSTAAEVAHAVTRPVVVVRGEERLGDQPVVVGVDGSPTSERAIGFAFEFAARHGCPITAVHAWSDLPLAVHDTGRVRALEPDELRSMAEEYLGGWQHRYPEVKVDWELVADRPARTLLEHAEDARLLAVGSHGRGTVRRALLGSVSHAVLHHANCPVAVLRGGENPA